FGGFDVVSEDHRRPKSTRPEPRERRLLAFGLDEQAVRVEAQQVLDASVERPFGKLGPRSTAANVGATGRKPEAAREQMLQSVVHLQLALAEAVLGSRDHPAFAQIREVGVVEVEGNEHAPVGSLDSPQGRAVSVLKNPDRLPRDWIPVETRVKPPLA